MLIQQISVNQDNYKIRFPKFKGVGSQVVNQAESVAKDAFIKSPEVQSLTTIKDVLNYIKANADKIDNGKIFNYPITPEGDSLLMAFFHIEPLPEEQEEYESILFKMSKMTEIDYDQEDSGHITALEWVVMAESLDELSLLKGKKVSYDPMLFYAYKRIKNPEFQKALLESGLYIPPVCDTSEEQKIIVSSIINDKHNGISDSSVENMVKALCNNENKILHKTIIVFKKIIHQSRIQDIEILPDVISLLKDNNGNILEERAAHFLAVYEQQNNTIQDAIQSLCKEYNLRYSGKTSAKLKYGTAEYKAKYDEYLPIQREFAQLVRKDYLTSSDKERLSYIINNYKDVLNEIWWQHDQSWWDEQLAKTGSYGGQRMNAYEERIVNEFNEAFAGTDDKSIARVAAMVQVHRDILEKYCPDRLRALGVYPGDDVSGLYQNMMDAADSSRGFMSGYRSRRGLSSNDTTSQLLELIRILSNF